MLIQDQDTIKPRICCSLPGNNETTGIGWWCAAAAAKTSAKPYNKFIVLLSCAKIVTQICSIPHAIHLSAKKSRGRIFFLILLLSKQNTFSDFQVPLLLFALCLFLFRFSVSRPPFLVHSMQTRGGAAAASSSSAAVKVSDPVIVIAVCLPLEQTREFVLARLFIL